MFNLWHWDLEYVRDGGRNDDYLNYWRNLPDPSQVTDPAFYAELGCCVYNAGMAERIVRIKWPALKEAFCGFDPRVMVLTGPTCIDQAVEVIGHRGKAQAVFDGAMQVVADGPMGERLAGMSIEDALAYLQTFSFIGSITKYHLARNVGLGVVKQDRHLVRLAQYLQYASPDELVREIAALTGERKGHIDFVLWRWLAWMGSARGIWRRRCERRDGVDLGRGDIGKGFADIARRILNMQRGSPISQGEPPDHNHPVLRTSLLYSNF